MTFPAKGINPTVGAGSRCSWQGLWHSSAYIALTVSLWACPALRGQLTVYAVDRDPVAKFAPGAWLRYRTVDEEEKGGEPLVG
jgi:hypothetical protein